jgi:hypothetical protein
MKTYKLVQNQITGVLSDYALEMVDGNFTGVNVHTETNQEYLKWLAEGNTPEPAEEQQ